MKYSILLLCLLLSNSNPVQGQLDNKEALETFFDKLIQTEVNKENIAGATISVVKDGLVTFQKGYGYADIEKEVKVDGKNTIFRVASISKLFVWVAIMKLYEERKLDLDDEITQYLPDLEIPNNYPQKITIKQLMSHSAGFEDEMIHLFAKTLDNNSSLGDILKRQMPSQIRRPGLHSSYSNHGTGMAAHIVENITQMSFMEYIEQEVLEPLNMTQSTFQQPLPPHLEQLYAKGYKKEGPLVEQAFEYVPLYPVGGASISGGDMIKFMQMLLNHGRLGETILLDSTTSQIMTTPSHQHHPLVNPMRHGLMDFSQNGILIYGHGGDLFYHHSILALFPEHNMGLFFSLNTDIIFPGLPVQLLIDFVDEFFPEKVEKLTPPSFETLAPFKGDYAMNRYSHDDILKLGKLAGTIEIEITEEGYLKTAFGDIVYHWVQQDDLVFRDVNSSEVLVFERGENGNITHAFVGGMPTMVLNKLEGFDKPIYHKIILGTTLSTFFITILYWLFRRKKEGVLAFPTTTKRLTATALASALLFQVGLGILFSNPLELIYGVSPYAYLLFFLPLLIVILTCMLLCHLVTIWDMEKTLSFWKKGAFSFICLCLVLSIVQWNYWNFIGFKF